MTAGEVEYRSKIVSKEVFTNKTAGVIGIIYLLIFTSIVCISSDSRILSVLSELNILYIPLVFAISYFLPIIIGLFYRIFTRTALIGSFVAGIIFSFYLIYTAIMAGSVYNGILSSLLSISLIFGLVSIFMDIDRIEAVVKIATEIILNNLPSYSVMYLYGTFIACALLLSVSSLFVMNDVHAFYSGKFTSIENISLFVYFLFSVAFIVFSYIWSLSCFYGKVSHQYMINKNTSSKKSVLVEGIRRMILSTGTIFMAASINSAIYVLRMFSDSASRNSYNNTRDTNLVFRIIIIVLLFILNLLIMFLDVTLQQLNTYCIVYNSIYGTDYVTSMKSAVDLVIRSEFGKYRFILSFSVFVSILVGNILISKYAMDVVKDKLGSSSDLIYFIFYALQYLGGIILSYSLITTVTAIEFISYVEPEIIKRTFPRRAAKILG